MSLQTINLKFKGLFTSPNDLSAVPLGGLERAENLVIDEEGKARPRRGMDDWLSSFGTISDRARKMFFFGDNLLVHFGTTIAWSPGPGGAWTSFANSYSAPTNFTITSVESNKNLLFTTNSGIKKIDLLTNEPVTAGVPKSLGFDMAVDSAVGGYLAANNIVNYRGCWGIKDGNGNLILGAPSQIQVFTNGASAKNVDFIVQIPQGITTSHFFQLYRSAQVATGISPSLELAQVYERSPTAAEITAGLMGKTLGGSVVNPTGTDIVDITADAIRGNNLYTNPSLGGPVVANDQPPLAKTIGRYKTYTIYMNTVSKYRFFINLLGTGTTAASLQAGDTVTIGLRVFTGAATEGANQFKVVGGTGGAPTSGFPSEDIRQTCISLIKAINGDASCFMYGFYLSDGTTTPGQMLFEERTIGGAGVSISVSRPAAFNPTNLGTPQAAVNDADKNKYFWSKSGQAEAVPLLNFGVAGNSQKNILSGKGLRDSFILLKEDGSYRLTGEAPFNLDPIDLTQELIGPDTAVVLNNAIHALTTQGAVIITEAGSQVIGLPIETDFQKLFGAALANIKTRGFGVAYETGRKYILFMPQSSTDTTCTIAYIYNVFTRAWTTWPLSKNCGIVHPSLDKLVLGSATKNSPDLERKTFTYTDYIDYGSVQTITFKSGKSLKLTGYDQISVGDIIYQSNTLFAFVTAKDNPTSVITVSDDIAFTLASATIYKAIPAVVRWTVNTAKNPSILKHFSDCVLYFRKTFNGPARISFASDYCPSYVDVTLTSDNNESGWGLFPWGLAPWGNANYRRPVRTYVTREHARCSQLSVEFAHSYAYSDWELEGMSLTYNPGSQRITR